jgi:glycolate oxidase iron-sulfur subunit
MLHSIPEDKFGPFTKPMTQAVEACVHCGFCLAACPTYQVLGQEMDSPRGRIVLMKQVLEGNLGWRQAQPHVDRCLGCLACEPACPSGVQYRDLISPFRALARKQFSRPLGERLRRWFVARTIPYPDSLRAALAGARLLRRLRLGLPAAFRPMLALAPKRLPAAATLRGAPARGGRRARVALLAGCAQQVLEPDINAATIEVLARNGIEVIVPVAQGCCGGLAWHTGDLRSARLLARRNLDAFPADVDAVVTNAAGCGSALHEYALMLRGTPDEDRARAFAERVCDAGAFLARLGLREAMRGFGGPRRIAYHDACHLANAQGVRAEPRLLLAAIPGVELCEVADAHLCCGSAGTYNLDQPAIATTLGAQKARAVAATGAQLVATGNIGCLLQLRQHLATLGSPLPVRHTFQVLRDAYAAGGA